MKLKAQSKYWKTQSRGVQNHLGYQIVITSIMRTYMCPLGIVAACKKYRSKIPPSLVLRDILKISP
jgi:hypothetical protein